MTKLLTTLHEMVTNRESVTSLEYVLVAAFVVAALLAAIPGLSQVVPGPDWGESPA